MKSESSSMGVRTYSSAHSLVGISDVYLSTKRGSFVVPKQNAHSHLLLVLPLFVVLLLSCEASEPRVVSLSETKSLQQVGTIEIQENDNRFIGTIAGCDVKLNPFRLYIADRKAERIVVVGDDGQIEGFVGQPGNGPGELRGPADVLVAGNRIVVLQSRLQGFATFDTTGTYRATYHLAEGHRYSGMYSLSADGEGGYIFPVTMNLETVQVSSDETAVARLNSAFEITETFGTFPSLYQEGEYVAQQRTLDVRNDSLAAVGYRLVPDVQLYNLTEEGIPKVSEVPLTHPAFQSPNREITRRLTQESQKAFYEALSNASVVGHTSLLENGVVVQSFANRTKAFFEKQGWPKSERDHYAVLGTVNSQERLHLRLPGRILARDEKDRLYVLINHTPDKRRIGIYKVNWP